MFDTEIKIAPADGSNDALPAGSQGEVLIRGPQIMHCYHNSPEATARTVAGGWLRTGDIGMLDRDGYLTILDRKRTC